MVCLSRGSLSSPTTSQKIFSGSVSQQRPTFGSRYLAIPMSKANMKRPDGEDICSKQLSKAVASAILPNIYVANLVLRSGGEIITWCGMGGQSESNFILNSMFNVF